MIRRPCTDFLTKPSACLPACPPACPPACLPACLLACLPACLPACLRQCLVQFGGGVGLIEGSDWFESFSMTIRWLYIRTVVVWGASLGGLNSIRWRANIKALVQFDRSIDWIVRGVYWLVVRTVVVWFWQRSSGSGDGRLLPASLPTCLPTYLSACLPACLSAYVST